MAEPTLWGRARGITAVVVTSNGVIVFGRNWHAVLRDFVLRDEEKRVNGG